MLHSYTYYTSPIHPKPVTIKPMRTIAFVTGNVRKIEEASAILQPYNIAVEQLPLDVVEIQHHDPIEITKAKAQAAYKIAGRPIVVNDSTWQIPTLGGFPGGYMKDVANWLSADDFLALMRSKQDTRILLREVVAYCDGDNLQLFTADFTGHFITEPRGKAGVSFNSVVVMDYAGGKTIAESFDARDTQNMQPQPKQNVHWQKFAEWFAAQ